MASEVPRGSKEQGFTCPYGDTDLRERIVTELRQQRDLNQSAVRAMRTRVEACVEKTGGHDGHWG